jgi:hypothetical protein
VVVSLFLAYFRLQTVALWVGKINFLKKYTRILSIVQYYNNALLWRFIALSALRYFIFAFQFYILLQLFFVHISLLYAMSTVFVIFWLMAVVPSIAIAEVGMRAQMSVLFLGAYSNNTFGIISASIILWFINLIIPALLGSLFTLGTKLFSAKETPAT